MTTTIAPLLECVTSLPSHQTVSRLPRNLSLRSYCAGCLSTLTDDGHLTEQALRFRLPTVTGDGHLTEQALCWPSTHCHGRRTVHWAGTVLAVSPLSRISHWEALLSASQTAHPAHALCLLGLLFQSSEAVVSCTRMIEWFKLTPSQHLLDVRILDMIFKVYTMLITMHGVEKLWWPSYTAFQLIWMKKHTSDIWNSVIYLFVIKYTPFSNLVYLMLICNITVGNSLYSKFFSSNYCCNFKYQL